MLPIGALSGVECWVTSMYIARAASSLNSDSGTSVRRPTMWNGVCASFHSTAAFSTQKLGSRRRPHRVISSASSSWSPISHVLIRGSSRR
jgi:hypothetical protein